MGRRRRHRAYFRLTGTCLVLILLAWDVVRLRSTTAAVAMSVVVAFAGNQGALDESAPPTFRVRWRA